MPVKLWVLFSKLNFLLKIDLCKDFFFFIIIIIFCLSNCATEKIGMQEIDHREECEKLERKKKDSTQVLNISSQYGIGAYTERASIWYHHERISIAKVLQGLLDSFAHNSSHLPHAPTFFLWYSLIPWNLSLKFSNKSPFKLYLHTIYITIYATLNHHGDLCFSLYKSLSLSSLFLHSYPIIFFLCLFSFSIPCFPQIPKLPFVKNKTQ